ncbi:MAG: HAMP domain-containing histidine kinase [Bacteroidales bacterium]|nr:HAMP domain-containing histidine kinase [Bacteroidales bacterium]
MQISPRHRRYIKWAILSLAVLMAIAALWYINRLSHQIQRSEQQKVRIWANAISQKNQIVHYTEDFFHNIAIDEHRKMALYTEVLRTLGNPNLQTDVAFSLAYVNYIMDSANTATIITDRDTVITSCRNIFDDSTDATLIGQKLRPPLLDDFSQNPPFQYTVWGMPFTLYYKESPIYTELRSMLHNLNESFLSDITNNSIFVPVIIVDSLQEQVLASGNINADLFNTPDRLCDLLCDIEQENTPIEIRLPDQQRAYVFYQSTPLLRQLRWFPLLYLFISFILLILAYLLFRTARTMEQNRIWVGMAKETAHQLGTPISSLIAWTEYLQDQTLTPQYADEIRKDLSRLETITHRFSKIGSVPELTPTDVGQTLHNAIAYLQSRSPKKVKFAITLPDEPMTAPLNAYLFEWVIENLCKNAIDAMGGDGTFSILATQDSRHIFIDISDTGKGIPSAIQKQIFHSGFTTKTRGWGLGLSLAKRIIEQYHKGKIFLKYSKEGQGTVFRIILRKENS